MIGALALAPLSDRFGRRNMLLFTPNMSVLGAMLLVSSFLVAAAIVAQFSVRSRDRHYEEISP